MSSLNVIRFIVFVITRLELDTSVNFAKGYTLADFPKLGIILTSPNSTAVTFPLTNLSLLPDHPNFNKNYKTFLYFFGYTQGFGNITVQTLIKAYHSRGENNFLIGDWAGHNRGDYIQLRDNLTDIGKLFAIKLHELQNSSNFTIRVSKIHVIGHSMGSNIAAKFSRTLLTLGNPLLERITSLDPAGLLIYDPVNIILQSPLNKNDAVFVDVIHTDSIYFGTSVAAGHVDFYVNKGRNQPNCSAGIDIFNIGAEENYCSHQRSVYYYAESVETLNKKTFRSFKCDQFLNQNQKFCRKLPIAYMGYHVDTKLPEGSYYLYTNNAFPFSKNEGFINHFWFESS